MDHPFENQKEGRLMREAAAQFLFFGMALSLGGYLLGLYFQKKFRLALMNPLLIAILFTISFLLFTGIDYHSYIKSADYLSYLLTPVTVCLAIPLYRQMNLLRQHATAIFAGILAGVLTSLVSVFLLGKLFALDKALIITLLPKSITTAIGMGLSEEFGGIATITVAAIVITGILGNMMGPWICKLLHITEPVAVGIAIGTSSHAIGTAKAMELGEVQGAMSSLAISVAGICTVPLIMLLIPFLEG